MARFFGTVGQKFLTENLDTPPPIQTFSLPQFNATVNDSPTQIFGIVRQKFSTENLDTLPPLLSINFSATANYCNSKVFPYGNFRHCETKKFRPEKRDITF